MSQPERSPERGLPLPWAGCVRGRGTWTFSVTLYDAARALLEEGRELVLDFASCDYLDSTFLGTVHEIVSSKSRSHGCHAELQGVGRPLMDLFDAEMAIFPDEVRILGDHAYSHGNYEYALKPKEGGETVSGKGKFLTILARQANGSWKIAIDCFNDNAPPAPA